LISLTLQEIAADDRTTESNLHERNGLMSLRLENLRTIEAVQERQPELERQEEKARRQLDYQRWLAVASQEEIRDALNASGFCVS
jgi:hypothetical protein